MGYYKNQEHAKRDARPASKSSKGGARSGGVSVRWNNVTLTSEQKDLLRQTDFDGGKALDTLAYYVETGHKLVVSPKNDRGFVSATIIGSTGECPNAGFGVSGEGGTAERAILALLLKLDILDGCICFEDAPADDDFR